MAYPVYQNLSSFNAVSFVSSVDITEPTSTASGNLLVCGIHWSSTGGSASTITPPTGWTEIVAVNETGGTGASTGLYYHQRGASAPSLTFTNSTGGYPFWVCFRVTGQISGDPTDGFASNKSPSATSLALSNVTTSVPQTLILAIGTSWAGNAGSMTNYVEVLESTGGNELDAYWSQGDFAGSNGGTTYSDSGSASTMTAMFVVIKPAPANFGRAIIKRRRNVFRRTYY